MIFTPCCRCDGHETRRSKCSRTYDKSSLKIFAVVSGLIYLPCDRCDFICWLGFICRKASNMFKTNIWFWEGKHVSDAGSSVRISSPEPDGIFWKACQVKKKSIRRNKKECVQCSSSPVFFCFFFFPRIEKVVSNLSYKAVFSFQMQPTFLSGSLRLML